MAIGFSLSRFLGDRSGNYAMMLVVLTLPLLAVSVKTVDYAVAAKLKADLQNLADSVALASVKGLEQSESAAREAGETVYRTGLVTLGFNFDSANLTLDLTVGADMVSHAEIKVSYRGMMGANWLIAPQSLYAEADALIGRRTQELAVATDLSPSMDAAEMAALIAALRQLTDSVFSGSAAKDGVRMAYAPFTRNVALPAYASAWISGTGTATPGRLCVGPRSAKLDATDTTPTAAIFPAFKESATYCPPEILQPLTSNPADIRALIDMVAKRAGPYRGTGVYEGLAWTYRMLSPQWAGVWPADAAPAKTANARKIALIMTDGFNDASVGYTKAVADQITLEACTNMKKDGIEIYVVTYKVTADLVALYSSCASSPSHFIDSPDDAALAKAFADMAERISKDSPILVN